MQYMYFILYNVVKFDLPNVIKGMEAKMPIRAIMTLHRIKVHAHHAKVHHDNNNY